MRSIANPPVAYSRNSNSGGGEFSPSHARTLTVAFRVVRWTIYACALAALVLLLHKSAPPPVLATSEAAARVEQKFQDVQQAVAQGESATLRMDETELNSYLASHLALEDPIGKTSTPNRDWSAADDVQQLRSNVRDVKVQLIDDRLKAYVVLDIHGKDMTLQLEGKLGTDNGFLKFQPVSGHLGALPIPQATLQVAVRKLMAAPENREKLRLPDDISDLKIENGEVVAQYQ